MFDASYTRSSIKKIALLLVFLFISFCSYTQKRFALLIGNSAYESQHALKNPVNDAKLIDSKLKECGFEVNMEINLSKRQIVEALGRFYNKIKEEPCVALFYYSGHGIQSDGENYIIPVNANMESKSDIPYECVPLGQVMGKLDESKSTTNIIILDACRNQPFTKSWYKGESGEKGLAPVSKTPKQSFIAYATGAGKVANDGSENNSPFSQALGKYIVEPGISINDVFYSVAADVTSVYMDQDPWTYSSLKTPFYFKPSRINVVGKNSGSPKTNQDANAVNVRFLSNANATLFINNDSVGKISSGSILPLNLTSGTYRIKAVSEEYPDISYQVTRNYQAIENEPIIENLQVSEKIWEAKYKKDVLALRRSVSAEDRQLTAVTEQIKHSMFMVEGREFDMGTPSGSNDESPVHKVQPSSFYLSRYEVTQQQWKTVMGSNPSVGAKDCNECPVNNISWEDANKFIEKLNDLTGEKYRLPTEAEWEYAARGGKLKSSYKFSGSSRIDRYGWCFENSAGKVQPVGSLATNLLGIFDMSGNVSEWCSDWYDKSYYKRSDVKDPKGPESGKTKVVRGGSSDDFEANCRVFARKEFAPDAKSKSIGIRLAKTVSN